MPPKYKSRKRADVYESDDGFVEDAPKSKKPKAASTVTESAQVQTDDEGNAFWEISSKRRVTISAFKGKQLLSIREYYEKDGKELPGKKGISLSMEQYATFVELMPHIEKMLESKGETVPRPVYDSKDITSITEAGDAGAEAGDEVHNSATKKRAEPPAAPSISHQKQNHEATSDED